MQTEQQPCAVAEELSGYLDGELSQQEQQRVMIHLRSCPHCQQLLADMQALRGDMKVAVHVSADARDLPKIMGDKPARWLGILGWSALILGVLLVTSFFFWELALDLLTNSSVPWWVRLGIAGFYLGLLGLFLMVLRQRLVAMKTDKYRKVKL
ncbi:anti-sigma factor [Aliidiomarina halalkaliphila]|uniref:Anti-sigma factor n=1 Tax=Aliidiomarina halalkaliphila TaxID=2593535 RepID=A0A552X0F9_9GAMM|nr:zf-HC2 domain-containing protein [Aliidiomarina halalkaliphila]TRW48425.1 anti-sigma factor [Aliidiomarina halalkaliphila]